uniref:Uncharacterized protein n=1 Tax=Sphaerodactylus townsendi TaxID=933632 RepID=A0ACB8EM20_9SAUR
MFLGSLCFFSRSKRSSLVISSPVRPTSSSFPPPKSSISEAPASAPAASSNHASETASTSSEAEEEDPASLATTFQDEVLDVAEPDSSAVREADDGNQAVVLEKPVSTVQDTPQNVQAFAKNVAAGIVSEALAAVAGQGQIVHKEPEDTTRPISTHNPETSDVGEKEGSSLPCRISVVPVPQKQESELSEDAQIEESDRQEDEPPPSNTLESPGKNLQDSESSTQAEATQDDIAGNTNGGLTPTAPKTGAIRKMLPHLTETGESSGQQFENADDDVSSEGSIEETDFSPKVINTQIASTFFSEDESQNDSKLPMDFLFKAQALQAHSSDEENHLQFGKGDIILVLSDAQAQPGTGSAGRTAAVKP